VEFVIPEGSYDAEFLARLRASGARFELISKRQARGLRGQGVFGFIDPKTDRRSSIEISDLFDFSSAF
jgi:hypothetical protein